MCKCGVTRAVVCGIRFVRQRFLVHTKVSISAISFVLSGCCCGNAAICLVASGRLLFVLLHGISGHDAVRMFSLS